MLNGGYSFFISVPVRIGHLDRKSTRLNSSHVEISYAVFGLKKKMGARQLLPLMHALIRLYHPAPGTLLASVWAERRTGMVRSVVPNFDRALLQRLAQAQARL